MKRSARLKQSRNNLDKFTTFLFKRRKISQILIINCLLIYLLGMTTLNYLTSPTNAAFNDIENVNASIHVKWDVPADQEWGKSSLSFLEGANDYGGSCNEIFATLMNGEDSGNMQILVNYEVYWVESGQIKKGEEILGTEVYEGPISKLLATGETLRLTYNPQDNPNGATGKYMLRAFQEEGHPGQGDLWSEGIEITCPENTSEPSPEIEETQNEVNEQGENVDNPDEKTDTNEMDINETDKTNSKQKENKSETKAPSDVIVEEKETTTEEEKKDKTDSGENNLNDGGESSESKKVD